MGRLVTEIKYMLPGSKLLAILAQKEMLSGDDPRTHSSIAYTYCLNQESNILPHQLSPEVMTPSLERGKTIYHYLEVSRYLAADILRYIV